MFIILAIVVLFVFVVYTFISGKTEGDDQNADQRISEKFQERIQPVSDFITSCIEQVTTKGLSLAGHQGGGIWVTCNKVNQDGPLNLDESRTAPPIGNYCIRYGIVKSQDQGNADYPWDVFPRVSSSASGITPTCNVCGSLKLPKLDGSNADDIEIVLENYVNANIELKCLKHLQSFRKEFEVNETTSPEVDVVFRDNDVFVKMNYSVSFYDNATKEFKELDVHKGTVPIRFRKLYNISSYISTNDIQFINYDIGQLPGAPAVPQPDPWKWARNPDFSIVVTPHDDDNYDLITVKDTKSKDLDGKAFTFSFARENRRPGLWLINGTEFEKTLTSNEFTINKADLSTYFTYAYYSPSPLFDPDHIKVWDPDEDDLHQGSLQFYVNVQRCVDTNLLDPNTPSCTFTLPPGEQKIPFIVKVVDVAGDELGIDHTDSQGDQSPSSSLFITLIAPAAGSP